MYIKWNENLKVGIKEIDDEHRSIINQYEKLYNEMKKGAGHESFYSYVNYLDKYIHNHFVNEEKIQNKLNYVAYEEHKEKHVLLTNEVKEFIISIRNKKITDSDLLRLNMFFRKFMNHIIIEDMKIGDFKRNSHR